MLKLYIIFPIMQSLSHHSTCQEDWNQELSYSSSDVTVCAVESPVTLYLQVSFKLIIRTKFVILSNDLDFNYTLFYRIFAEIWIQGLS